MRLLRLTLVRFRHFVDASLSLAPAPGAKSRLVVVHGDNEAGKSSILEAIRCLLFGFPHQAKELLPIDRSFEMSELAVGGEIELLKIEQPVRVGLLRKKTQKASLTARMLESGDDVGEDWLQQRLSHPHRQLFESVFAFSLDALARGSAELSRDEVRGAIYGAGLSASVRPQRLLADLARERDALFTERAQKPRINATLRRIEELEKAGRSATITADELRRLREDQAAKKAVADATGERVAQLRTAASRARARVDGLGPLLAMRAAERELELLPVAAKQLSAETVTSFAAMTIAAERATHELGVQEKDVGDLEAEAVALGTSTIGEDAEIIEDLHRRLPSFRDATSARHRVRGELETVVRDAEVRLDVLAPAWSAERLRHAALDSTKRFTVEEASRRSEDLAGERHRLLGSLRDVDAHLSSLEARMRSLPAPLTAAELGGLDEWLAGCSLALADEKRIASFEVAISEATRQVNAHLRRLEATLGSADPAAIRPPPREEVQAIASAYAILDRRAEVLAASVTAREADRDRLAADRATLAAEGVAPTEPELRTARARRDEGIRLLAAQAAGESDAAAMTAFDRGAPFGRAVVDAVNVADAVVDDMRRRANAVERRIAIEGRAAELEANLATLARERGQLLDERARLDERWIGSWSSCGIRPLAPSVMEAWLRDRDAFLDARARLDESRATRDEHFARQESFIARGRTLLQIATGSITALRELAQRRVEAEHARASDVSAIAAARERDEVQSSATRAALERTRIESVELTARLDALADELAPTTKGSPAALRAVVLGLVELRQRFLPEEQRLTAQAATIDHELSRFREEVLRVLPLATTDDAVVTQLERRAGEVRAARELKRRIDELARSLTSARSRRERVSTSLAELEATRAGLRNEVSAASDDEFRRLAELSTRAHALQRIVEERSRELRLVAGTDLDALVLELEGCDESSLREALAAAERELSMVEVERRRRDEEVGSAVTALARVDDGADAADARAAAEAERAQLRADVERYAAIVVAESLLDAAIKRFERENQPLMLAEAGALLRTMTLGRWAHVRYGLDAVLTVATEDERRVVHPEQLSTGTREQLFLALRLAYVRQYQRTAEALPVVLDDVLVNFDEPRTLATLAALTEYAEKTQVLVFTCHRHVVELAERAGATIVRVPTSR